MPHPDAEHSLRIQLAAALRELDEAREQTERWLRVVEKLRENLNVTLLERDALRADAKRLREALGHVLSLARCSQNDFALEIVSYTGAALAGGGDRG